MSKIINNMEPSLDVVKRSIEVAGINVKENLQQQFKWQLKYNEYIVYNVDQVLIRYMI